MSYTPGLNGGRINATIGGNTAGAGALISTGTLNLMGGNNITLSQNGQSLTISGGAGGGGVMLSGSNNSITSGTASFVNANGMSWSFNGQSISGSVNTSYLGSNASTNYVQANAGFNGTNASGTIASNAVSVSVAAQSVQPAVVISASNNSMTSGTVSFVNANGVSWSANGQSLSASISQGGVANAAGTQTATSGTVNFANSNGISFGMSGSTQITASYTVPTQTNQTLSQAITGNTTGNTSGMSVDARSLTYQGLGAASVGISTSAGGSSLIFSSPTQTVQPAAVLSGAGGSITSGTASFVNANGFSFSVNGQSVSGSVATTYLGSNASTNYVQANAGFNGTNASGTIASNSVSVSVAAQTNQTMGMYAVGNTTQNSSTTLDARTLSFNAVGMASLGYSNGSIMVSIPNTNNFVGTNTIGMSNLGNTLGTSGVVTGSNFNMVFAGGSNITLSQSINASSGTITINGPAPLQQYVHNSAALYSSSTGIMINTSVSLVRMLIPEQLSFTRVDVPVSVSLGASSATTNTAAMAISAVGVIYSRNGSTLNAIVGQSSTTTYSYASNTANYSSVSGAKLFSFNLATSLSAGEYYFGFQMSSNTSSVGLSTTNIGWSVAPIFGTSYSVLPFTEMTIGTASTFNGIQPLQGVNSVSISNTSQTHQASQITQFSSAAQRANIIVMFRNA